MESCHEVLTQTTLGTPESQMAVAGSRYASAIRK
jgi:hypothetical protein